MLTCSDFELCSKPAWVDDFRTVVAVLPLTFELNERHKYRSIPQVVVLVKCI